MNSSLCLIPFSSLHVAPDGSLRLCSSNLNKMFTENEVTSLKEMWHGDRYQSLRKAMIDDRKPKVCENACYAQEARHLYSKREKYNTAKQKDWEQGDIIIDTEVPPIRYLDVAFSNICNLKCVMCTSHYSSSWRSEDRKAIDEGIEFRKIVSPLNKIREGLTEEYLELTPQLFGVWIKGGEPFADEQCLSYLKRLSERANWNEKFYVFIQSNGTLWNKNIQSSLRGIPLDIGISVDGTDSVYEWVRGFSFEKLKENIVAITQCTDVRATMIDFTLSAYNVFNIVDTVKFYQALKAQNPKLKSFHFAGIVRQEWGNVYGVPLQIRWNIAQQLREVSQNWGADVVGLESVLKVLERHDPKEQYFRETCARWMDFCNRMRGVTLSSVDERYGYLFSTNYEYPHTVD